MITQNLMCKSFHSYTKSITTNNVKSSTVDSCNMGTSDLPDMYTQSPRAAALGLWAYISGKSLAHVTTIMQHLPSELCSS